MLRTGTHHRSFQTADGFHACVRDGYAEPGDGWMQIDHAIPYRAKCTQKRSRINGLGRPRQRPDERFVSRWA